MSYTQAEKLQLLMLCDIYKALGIKNSFDPNLIDEAVSTDNTWAIGWQYQSLSDGSDKPAHVKLFADTVEMYEMLEYTYNQMSAQDKAHVATAIPYFNPKTSLTFPGFDGNNESEYRSVGDMFKLMGLWQNVDLTRNSHCQKSEQYQDMLDIYLPARSSTWSNGVGISLNSFISVLSV
ncbi:YfbU family protein [Pantoea dispersa]|uniref:YfbU family protein n=1 Tax=Pantoea dispersa TaxID=59814 RepID=UPI003215DDD0